MHVASASLSSFQFILTKPLHHKPFSTSQAEIFLNRDNKKNSHLINAFPQAMVAHGRVELLAHPLSQKYLQMKWNSYGKYFHLANLLFYSVFLLFVTVFTSQLMTNTPLTVTSYINVSNPMMWNSLFVYATKESLLKEPKVKPRLTALHYKFHSQENTTLAGIPDAEHDQPQPIMMASRSAPRQHMQYRNHTINNTAEHMPITTATLVSGVAIIIYIFCNALREILQAYQQKWHYLIEPINLVSWILYISALIMVWPMFNNGLCYSGNFSAASVTVFLSWFNLLLFLQRFDQVSKRLKRIPKIITCLLKTVS